MLYPVYVHHEEGSAFGVTVPDFPGCFSAADSWDDLPRLTQEAIEVHCEGEELGIPVPSPIDELTGDEYQDGQWVFVDVDLTRLSSKAKRINVTIRESLLSQIDEVVRSKKMNRSGFLAMAAEKELERQ